MYVEALQNTSLCFQDADLTRADPRVDRFGRPRAISGNFASVFSLTTATGKRYAVKCFTQEVADQEGRYRAISEYLSAAPHSWKVGFTYLEHGVLVTGSWYPVLKMDWVDATNLTNWIDNHLHDSTALAGLAESFVEVVNDLSASGIGHGDLQHGNLLVNETGDIRLVDYDGMYVPALNGLPASELGHRNYQSPARSESYFGPTVDRFSTWVVYLSLIALAADPMLWQQLRDRDAEYLLLAEEDFKQPNSSFRLAALLSHSDPAIRGAAERFHDILLHPSNTPPELTPVCVDLAMAPGPGPTPSVRRSGDALPAWLVGHLDQPSALPTVMFARPPVAARFGGLAAGALLAIAGLLTALGVLDALAFIGVTAAAVTAWAGCAILAYWQQPETGQARRARARRREATGRVDAASRELTDLYKQTSAMDRADEARQASHARRQRDIEQRYERDVAAAQRSVHKNLAQIDAGLRSLSIEQSKAEEVAIRGIQAEHVRSYLARFSVSAARIAGIGPALVANLRAAGIVTAADFTGVRYLATSQYQTRIAMFQLANGRTMRVSGIGEVKAARLEDWRQAVEVRARNTQPTTLPQSQRRAIANGFSARESALRSQRQQVMRDGSAAQSTLIAKFNTDRTDLADEFRRANIAAARARKEHDQKVALAKLAAEKERRLTAAIITEADSYSRISYVSYLRFALWGSSRGGRAGRA